MDYLQKIYKGNQIILVDPSLEAYDEILEKRIDFIGTRLHAGIRAMQKKCRTVIISVDNRAEDMKKDINLCVVSRNELDTLETLIYRKMPTQLNIKMENIQKWLSQFR